MNNSHTIEYDCECEHCNGTGLYIGMGERSGAAVVCSHCQGTGKEHVKITYTDFTEKRKRRGVQRVFRVNPGIGIGAGVSEKYGKVELKDFGGMSYEDWFAGKRFPKKSEMRKFTCPAWWYQCVNFEKKPKWKECVLAESFSKCRLFAQRDKCWERWDREASTRGRGGTRKG